MKYILFAFFLSTSFLVQAQDGIDFFHGTWEEALEKAEKEDKLIFVDAYAVWCGPCKRMAKNVFTQKSVGDFYNKHFVNLKIDMEKGQGLAFRKKYPVQAFPTLFYIDYDGKTIQKVKGAQKVDNFLKLGKSVLSKVDRSAQYATQYEEGNREPKLIYDYIKALNQAGKSSTKIANEYIRSQKDLSSEMNLKILLESTVTADSRLFDLMIDNKGQIEKLLGKEVVNERITMACAKTAERAAEFESKDLLNDAKAKMKKYNSSESTAFAAQADMNFARKTNDYKGYVKACQTYAKKVLKGDAEALNKLAMDMEKTFGRNEDCMECAEKFAKNAAQTGKTYNFYYTYAKILYQNGKQAEALEAAQTSLSLAKEVGGGAERMVSGLLQKIQQG